jgi:hypothetical protein
VDKILVQSSNLIAVGYDPQQQLLEVEFQSGSAYRYMGVPHELYQRLMVAPSKGQYFHDYIMNKFDFAQI